MAKSMLVMAPEGTIFQVPSGAEPICVFDENGGPLSQDVAGWWSTYPSEQYMEKKTCSKPPTSIGTSCTFSKVVFAQSMCTTGIIGVAPDSANESITPFEQHQTDLFCLVDVVKQMCDASISPLHTTARDLSPAVSAAKNGRSSRAFMKFMLLLSPSQ